MYTHSLPPLAQTAAALRSGDLPLAEYLNQLCDRIDEVEPHIEALLPEEGRRERLLREAAELEARYPEPDGRPHLFGVPVGVKDIYRVAGFETRCGSNLPAELFRGPEASSVTRLKEAGALILGKTVTTEFAYFAPGPTRNPHDPGHTPGGSSSGSAAAVAAGFCPIALGSQTVGSVIRPAAFCGVVGYKPTFGAVALDGVIPYAPSLDTFGVFVQKAEDLPPVGALFLGEREELRPAPRTLGIPAGPYLEQASDETLALLEWQALYLQNRGYTIHRIPVMADIEEINARHQTLACAEMASVHAEWFLPNEPLYHARTAGQIRAGRAAIGREEAAREGCGRLREELDQAMVEAGVDAWICPASVDGAPEGLAFTGDPAMNLPWTQAGMPVITIPAGTMANGLPFGLQLVGHIDDDRWLISLAVQLEQELANAG